MHYLDSGGIAAGIWGVFFLVMPLYRRFKESAEKTVNLPQPILSGALSPKNLKLVFGDSPSYSCTLQFLILLARCAGNNAFCCHGWRAMAEHICPEFCHTLEYFLS